MTLSLIITALLHRWADSWRRMRGDQRVHASAATGKGADQDLLRAHVWGVWARGDSLHHDSYTCHMYPGATAWPTQRLNTTDHNFFGAVGPVEFMQVCPEQCRRKKAMRRTGFTAEAGSDIIEPCKSTLCFMQ